MELSTQFFSLCKPFEGSRAEADPHNYYMEREWRVLGNLRFTLDEVCRVILPPSFARRFRADVSDYCGQVTFAE